LIGARVEVLAGKHWLQWVGLPERSKWMVAWRERGARFGKKY